MVRTDVVLLNLPILNGPGKTARYQISTQVPQISTQTTPVHFLVDDYTLKVYAKHCSLHPLNAYASI